MTILAIIYVSLMFIGLIITSYCNTVYEEEQEQEWRKLQELKRIASLKIIKCKTCGASVRTTQKCPYCGNQN